MNLPGILEKLPLQLHHAESLLDVVGRLNVDAEPEAVEQLRSQLTLLRIHRPDQDEIGRVNDGHPLALDHVDPHGRRIEENVDQVVVEQIHLVDI